MDIFDHVSITVADFDAAVVFYEAVLAPLGIVKKFALARPDGQVAGFGRDRVAFFVKGAGADQPALHLAFAAHSRSEVDAFHAAASKAGGRDNGAPGIRDRYHANYYAAFVFDPAGNNIEAVFHGAK